MNWIELWYVVYMGVYMDFGQTFSEFVYHMNGEFVLSINCIRDFGDITYAVAILNVHSFSSTSLDLEIVTFSSGRFRYYFIFVLSA